MNNQVLIFIKIVDPTPIFKYPLFFGLFMALENYLHYGIRETLCESPKPQRGYSLPNTNIQKSIIEYVFGNSKILIPSYLLQGPLHLWSFRALAEQQNFASLVSKDKRVLSITQEIKDIYLNKIITDKNITASDLVEKHMIALVRILSDPYLSSEEFYGRASVLKENLLKYHKTYVPEEVLFPEYYAEQEKIVKRKKEFSFSSSYKKRFSMAA